MTSAQELGINGAAEAPELPGHVLIVDDEDIIRVLLAEILTEEGYQVTAATSGEEAVALLERERFDLVISDMVMPGTNGIEVLQAAFRIDSDYSVIMVTGYPSVDTAVRLVNLGAADYITKPFNVDLIKVTVAKVLEMKKVRAETHRAESTEQGTVIDRVTGAYNLQVFDQLLDTEVQRSGYRHHELSLLVVQIDNFESYTREDPSGGDQLLEALASGLRKECRPGDVLGRLDSAQLAVILPETGRNQVESLAQRIRKNVEWNFTLSGGIGCLPRNATDAESLLNTARSAMRAAESRGGNAILLPK